MTFLLYIAIIYLLVTSLILLLNKMDFKALPSVKDHYFDRQAPSVSICIPARNEANSIERCIRSAVDQQYPNVQVTVLDDNSTDETPKILKQLSSEFADELTVIPGRPKPDHWLGKPWACHQLSKRTDSDLLIFIDADTTLSPKTTAKVVRAMGQDVVDFITLWPQQQFGTFWESTVIPLVYFALLTLLPTRYVSRPPKWIPAPLRDKVRPLFAAACGQFMAFKRDTYEAIGGHKAVKDQIVEDVALAKEVKRHGFSMNMYHGAKSVRCRMYRSSQELWQGFRKNFFAGFDYNITLFVGMSLIQFITFILPALAFPFLLFAGTNKLAILCTISIVLGLAQRFIVDRWFNWHFFYGLLHPLAVAWFQLLGLRVLTDYFNDNPPRWKDRTL